MLRRCLAAGVTGAGCKLVAHKNPQDAEIAGWKVFEGGTARCTAHCVLHTLTVAKAASHRRSQRTGNQSALSTSLPQEIPDLAHIWQ